jgi:hypothetical protein
MRVLKKGDRKQPSIELWTRKIFRVRRTPTTLTSYGLLTPGIKCKEEVMHPEVTRIISEKSEMDSGSTRTPHLFDYLTIGQTQACLNTSST